MESMLAVGVSLSHISTMYLEKYENWNTHAQVLKYPKRLILNDLHELAPKVAYIGFDSNQLLRKVIHTAQESPSNQ
jgi:hypothetical protein